MMNALWEQSPRTITELVQALKEDTGWTKHTVITMLNRLEDKGAVAYHAGKARQYYPLIAYDQAAARETESFLQKVYQGKLGLLVNHLVEEQSLTPDEVAELYDILKKAEEGQV